SQQAMADALQIPPSRMVSLIDELEDKGLVERRSHPSDRRARAIYVTDKGREAAASAMQLAMGHERAVCSSLTQAEREQLIELLLRVAASQGLQPGVHPDLARAEEMQPPHG
ncbi:MAG TPA: MarR family transcriptional regulator, partial [Acidimicrobiales bacterium]|nr:MarR family transcriptional regulator [Acidimicrobiales bacterium]